MSNKIDGFGGNLDEAFEPAGMVMVPRQVAKELVRLADIMRDCGRLVSTSGAAETTMRNAAAMIAAAPAPAVPAWPAPEDLQRAKEDSKRFAPLFESTAPAAPRHVRKIGGSFQHTGTVVAEFQTLAGEPRIVLEFDAPVAGMLHVYRPDQVAPCESAAPAVRDARIKVLEDALHVVMNYTETHSKAHIAARAALGDKTCSG